MTHADLVKRAMRWLRNTKNCGVVASECIGLVHERPDAMGWSGGWAVLEGRYVEEGYSILLECKVSRNDFRNDLQKLSRVHSEYGLGNFRYYMTPPGLLKPDELPERWGLLEAHKTQVHVKKEASRFDSLIVAANERCILVILLCEQMRRNCKGWVGSENWAAVGGGVPFVRHGAGRS